MSSPNFYYRLSRTLDLNSLVLKVLDNEKNLVYITLLQGSKIQDFNFALEEGNIDVEFLCNSFMMELSFTNFYNEKVNVLLYLLGSKNSIINLPNLVQKKNLSIHHIENERIGQKRKLSLKQFYSKRQKLYCHFSLNNN